MKKYFGVTWKYLLVIATLVVLCWGTWQLGKYFSWDWGGFWSNFISNAGSSAIIGFVLYLIITRPDEKKAANKRRAQALAMLKIDFQIDLKRAQIYIKGLKAPEEDLKPLYPLHFTRGAWNALRESGFLPQLEDVEFVYELLRVNEVIMVANSSLSTIRRSKANGKKTVLVTYANKAVNECTQIEAYLVPILAKLEKMKLPKIDFPEDGNVYNTADDDEGNNGAEEN